MSRLPRLAIVILGLLCANVNAAPLTFCCAADNDVYRALAKTADQAPARFDTPADAIANAPRESGVLVLADGYPKSRTAVDAKLLEAAREKRLRLFIEYPQSIPGVELGEPRTAAWERVVVANDALKSGNLPQLRILGAHGCSYLPATGVKDPLLTLARVAGYDSAVYGLPKEHFPILFRTPGGELIATTKLSNFLTARYAPAAQWVDVWSYIFDQLDPGHKRALDFDAVVRPTHVPDAPLPKDAEKQAAERFAGWLSRSGLLVPKQREPELTKLIASGTINVAAPTPDEPKGDGTFGILEGYAAQISHDGQQMRYTSVRADCQTESAMVLALAGDDRSQVIAKNLLDFTYFKSDLHGGVRGDPKHPAYGLIAWGTHSPAWKVANYGDDNARTLLGTMLAAAALKSDAWDESMLRALYANLRTTGKFGFRGDRIDIPALEQHGWQHFRDAETINYALNFEAYLWACYLWAYQQTGDAEFLEKSRTALRMTMSAYPKGWRWGDNMERARILLPLAWLVRVDDKPEHRKWLAQIATDLVARQHASGGIAEHLGGDGTGGGHYVVPATNEAYGTTETPLIQRNGDPVSDQLYTTGFALIGLHEAAAATGDPKLRAAADKLASYLVRIQVDAPKLPNLDGTWFRAFDFGKWDYWASSADVGWGAWSAEAGWGPAWIAATLGLRVKDTSLWDFTSDSSIEKHMTRTKALMQ
jgi:hypothetical protein